MKRRTFESLVQARLERAVMERDALLDQAAALGREIARYEATLVDEEPIRGNIIEDEEETA